MDDTLKLKNLHTAIKQKFKGKNLVFGHGPLDAKIVFVSEMVGSDEDREQKPMAGANAKLLNQILKKAGIDKRKIYITNVVKYSTPSGNIQPSPKEVKSHATFLKEELKTINPKIVVTFGNLALNGVGMRQPIENVHGRTFNLGSYELLPTFHPQMALNNPQIKSLLEADFIKLKTLLNNKEGSDENT